MAAIIGVPPDVLLSICAEAAQGEIVSAANYNAPGQIVIAGTAAAVERASALAAERRGTAIPLKVSAPFHCALMAPAARALEAGLSKVEISAMAFPVVANVDAVANSDPAQVKDLLVRQVDHPVRWEESVRAMDAAGITVALEIGPGKVLANLMKRIAKQIKVIPVGDAEGIEAAAALFS